MDLPILSAAVFGLAALFVSDGPSVLQSSSTRTAIAKAEGPTALVGQRLYGSEDPIALWDGPVRAEDLSLQDLGRVAEVVTSPEGKAEAVVVAVGGLWGYGSQEVRLGMQRVHLIRAADGGQQLVVDLSNSGAEPVEG